MHPSTKSDRIKRRTVIPTKLTLDAYIRVSRVGGRQGDSFISPDVQRQDIQRWAQLRGVTIAQWHEDLDETGTKMNRPAFAAMMERVHAGKTGGVVVAKLDRFARNVPEGLTAIRDLVSRGAEFSSVAESIDPTGPFGKFAMTVLLAVSELDVNKIADSWTVAREHAIERGVFIGPAPFGYYATDSGVLACDPETHKAVLKAFEMRGQGETYQSIADWLNGRFTTSTGSAWIAQTVAKMLGSRVYLGEARHGKLVNETAHDAIVSPEVWNVAQAVPSNRSTQSKRMLAGLLRCGGCRHTLRGKGIYYRCAVTHSGGTCAAPTTVKAVDIETHVLREFFARIEPPAFAIERTPAALADAQTNLTVAQSALDDFKDPRVQAAICHDDWLAGLEDRALKLEAAKKAVSTLRVELHGIDGPTTVDAWAHLDANEKRKILGSVIEAVFVRSGHGPVNKRSKVFWLGECPDDIPRRGRTNGGAFKTRPLKW